MEYDNEYQWWTFEYGGEEFIAYGFEFDLPSEEVLKTTLKSIEVLRGEMTNRIKKRFEQYNDLNLSKLPEIMINIEKLAKQNLFEITCSNEEWGDLSVDFHIKDGFIIGESWGD